MEAIQFISLGRHAMYKICIHNSDGTFMGHCAKNKKKNSQYIVVVQVNRVYNFLFSCIKQGHPLQRNTVALQVAVKNCAV